MGLLKAIGLAKSEEQPPVGTRAPQITTVDQDGNKVDLGEIFQDGLTLLYFFPRAHTPVCAAQACEFRDHYPQWQEHEVRLFGISRDKQESQKRFQEKLKLPFPLLSDVDGKITRAFGVPITFGLSQRQTFLIKDGLIVWRDLHARVNDQSTTILAALKHLK